MATYATGARVRHPARRIAALRANPVVAVTIDTNAEALLVRGQVTVTEVRDSPPGRRGYLMTTDATSPAPVIVDRAT